MDKETIINLFRKIITSLLCIEKTTNNNQLKKESLEYLYNFINYYKIIIETNDINNIKIDCNEEDIIDFSYRCIEDRETDLVRFAEDVQFSIIEIKKIIK